jgi:baculoviral IAP repeat-containing protein 7/8
MASSMDLRSTSSDDDNHSISELLGAKTDEGWSAFGIINHPGPVHENYITKHSRLMTYTSWPTCLSQRPQDLANAGFFYTRWGDRVKCFYCDGGLESWETDDVPLKEHKKWFSGCAFVKLKSEESIACETLIFDKLKLISLDETPSFKLETLQKEVEILEKARRCKICLEQPSSIVFLSCGHLCCCIDCGTTQQVSLKIYYFYLNFYLLFILFCRTVPVAILQ